MFRPRIPAVLAVAAVAAVTAVQFAGAVTTVATAKVPFTDEDAKGYVGFCDATGKQVTSGRIDTHPFIVKAVSSTAAPQDYRAEIGGKATVYVFQPRRGTLPAEWSGRQVTAASFYSNSRAPMAAGTELDYSLADFLSVYPASWDGLLQLRMFLSAPNKPVQLRPYAAAVIKVSGSRWSTVGGGRVDCGAGKARSSELTNLSPEQFRAALANVRKQRATQQAAAGKNGSTASTGASGGSGGGSGGTGASGGAGTSADGAAAGSATQASRTADDGGSAVLWIVVALAAALLVGVAVVVVRRRPSAGD